MPLEFPPQVVAGGLGIHVYDNTACTVEGFFKYCGLLGQSAQTRDGVWGYLLSRERLFVASMQEGVISFTGVIEQIQYGSAEGREEAP